MRTTLDLEEDVLLAVKGQGEDGAPEIITP